MDRVRPEEVHRDGADAVVDGGRFTPQPEFRTVYRDFAPLLRYLAIHRCSVPPCDADALVHDVFATWLRAKERIRGEARPYLVGAIYKASRRYWHRRRGEEPLTDDVVEAVPPCEDVTDAVALRLALASMLAQLSPRCREAFRRYYLDGEPTESIAAAMCTSPGNVRYILHGCRKRARSIYEQITRVPDAGAF